MWKRAILTILIILALIVLYKGLSFKPPPAPPQPQPSGSATVPSEMPLIQAVKQGLVQAIAAGEGVINSVSLTLSSQHTITVVIPTGTVLAGGPDTQRMMVARTIRVALVGGAAPETVKLETYCINRFLDVPELSSELTIDDDQPEESHPVTQLARCLEGKSIDPDLRQLSIWVVADRLWDLSPDELTDRLRKDMEKKVESLDDDALVDFIKENLSEEDAETLKALIKAEGSNKVRSEIRVALEEVVQKEVSEYREATPAVLKNCGFDVAGKRLFRT